ncbi:hypothetical protein ACSBR2_017581 [Camellia fascicularis]
MQMVQMLVQMQHMNHFEVRSASDLPLCSSTQNLSAASDLFTSSIEVLLPRKDTDKVVDEIGEQYVVQVVTDNEPALKAAGKMLMRKRKHLYWTACSAHCIDLMLKDIANKKSVAKVIEDGKTITNFIYNSGWVLDLMRKFTGGRELIRPAITRFATNFIAIESIIRYKQQLRATFNSDEWKNSRWGKAKTGQPYNVKKKLFWERSFARKQQSFVKFMSP